MTGTGTTSSAAGSVPTAATTGKDLLVTIGNVGVVLEYKIEDLEASYVVRVVSGKLKDQVISYSPASLLSHSETMCQVTLPLLVFSAFKFQ